MASKFWIKLYHEVLDDPKMEGVPQAKKDDLQSLITELREWLDNNQEASVDEFNDKINELQTRSGNIMGMPTDMPNTEDVNDPTIEEVD